MIVVLDDEVEMGDHDGSDEVVKTEIVGVVAVGIADETGEGVHHCYKVPATDHLVYARSTSLALSLNEGRKRSKRR